MTTKANKKANAEINGAELIAKLGTKSAAIRHLDSEGFTRSQIAKTLDIRYQHVRNVLITPLKKA